MNIAFVASLSNHHSLMNLEEGRRVTERWVISEEDAPKLIGNRVSLHMHQKDESYISGIVLGVYIAGKSDGGRTRHGIVFEADEVKVDGSQLDWAREQARY